MIELLLKSSLAIGIALLFYKLVLQQESFFATNRLYLLGCLLLAFALPFINLPKLVAQQGYLSSVIAEKFSAEGAPEEGYSAAPERSAITQFSVLPTPSEEPPTLSKVPPQSTEVLPPAKELRQQTALSEQPQAAEDFWIPVLSLQSWLMLLYLFGVIILFLSLLFQVSCIFFEIIKARDKIRDGNYVIVNTNTRKSPCSFFKYIFIYPDDYDFEAYEQIIKHEKTHVRLGHSFDLLLAELAVVVLWFNPLIWLYKKEIEKNNEYQTDSILVEKEQVRKDQYQLNLLQIAVPNKPLNITTNYNQSLIKKRIIMINSKRSTRHAYWKYAFLLPLFLGMLLLINEPATSQEVKENHSADLEQEHMTSEDNHRDNLRERKEHVLRNRQNVIERNVDQDQKREQLEARVAQAEARRENVQQRVEQRKQIIDRRKVSLVEREAQVNMTRGVWYSSVRNGKICIEFRGSSEKAKWNMSDCFERAAFRKTGENSFVMSNEAGTLELTGDLREEVAQGNYIFKENPSFRNLLTRNDISGVTGNTMFHLFFGGMTKNYVNFLVEEYSDVDGEDLTALAIHEVDESQFINFVNLFKRHSNEKPGIGDIVGLKIHGVTEDYVRELQKIGFSNLDIDDIMSAKIHDVSASYFQDLKNAGFTDLSMDEIITAKIHDVAPETIKEMRALGARDLDEIVQLQIHDVDAAYVKELQKAGLEDLSLDEIVSAKIHDLDAASVKEIRAMGFKNLDFDDLLTAQIHGVKPEFVKDLREAGFANLDITDIVSARIHDIDLAFIQNARKNGYNLNSIDNYISLKIHGNEIGRAHV